MDKMKRRDSGASEVIGAVLLVGLVVIGGAVVAAFVFGQPTPKEMPHVSFGVSLDDTDSLTLHHTGGDTLMRSNYTVYVYYTDGERSEATKDETNVTWSSGGDLSISRDSEKQVGHVILAYTDGSGGETVLRRVPIEDVGSETDTPTSTPTVTPTSTIQPGSGYISGFKWNDLDGDHKWDNGEPPLAGWTIYAMVQGDGSSWSEAGRATTGADGFYIISGLSEGHYRVYEIQQDGWDQTYPTDAGGFHNFNLNHGHPSMEDQNFGNHQLTMISGRKYSDQNANHQYDTGESYLSGWTVRLYRQNGGIWDLVTSTTTDAEGVYQFSDVANGNYRVAEVQQSNWYQTAPTTNEGTHLVTISDAQKYVTGLDFGNHDGPIAGYGNYMVLNNPHNSAVMRDGYYIQFQNHGPWDYVTIAGQRIDVPSGSTVRLEINGDQTSGWIYMIHRQVSTFSFNSRLYVNGQLLRSGWISEIWFAGTDHGAGVDQFVSNIHYLMPQMVSGMQFTVDGRQIVDPPWWPYTNWGVHIYNFGPASHPGGWEDTVLNLDLRDGKTYLVCSGWYEVIK